MYYLIGKVLGHSYSAEIHRAFGRYPYELKSLPPEALEGFFAEGEFDGLNVTIPYKSAVIPYLYAIDDAAKKIGSVNTVVREGGRLVGHNTDYAGFSSMARRAGISFRGKKVLILGTGGTSLTAQAVVRDEGAAEVAVLSRRGERSYATLPRHYDSHIIINSTPVGMFPQNGEELIDLRKFDRVEGVLDVIYNPLRTKLVDTAERMGIAAVGGLWMLVAQAALACGYFSGECPDEKEVEGVYRSLLTEKENIVLVGMPGSGKSTVAALLAARTGRELLDTDSMVEAEAGMTVPEVFRRYGEPHFRALESKAIAEAGKRSGCIIATGGGAVLDRANRYPLAQNGKIYFLCRDLSGLDRSGRPLSSGADLAEMLARRLPCYRAFADREIDNNRTPEAAADEIWEDYYAYPDCKRTEP